jgi:hypothetical protein
LNLKLFKNSVYNSSEGRRSGGRKRWLKAKDKAPLVAGGSAEELVEVSNGVGGGIEEPECSKFTGA